MNKLYRFHWGGYYGELHGAFVADDAEVSKAIGKLIYFGEVLGKHSEVAEYLDTDDIEVISEDQHFIEQFKEIVGEVGYNPLKYIKDQDDDDGS